MKRGALRLGLSLVLAMGWWVQRLPAQNPPTPMPATPAQPPAAPIVGEPVHSEPGSSQKGFFHRLLNRHGYGCHSTHNDFGCGSPHSDLTFIFGSCRTFFGEPCAPSPQRPTRP